MTTEIIAGFTHVDDKGRVSLAKPVRQALGLKAGASVAWLKIGNAVLFIPQDQHIEHLMDAATQVLERATVGVSEMLDDLPAARAEAVAEHYGEMFLSTLERMREEQVAASMP